jgi:hypothetical protein
MMQVRLNWGEMRDFKVAGVNFQAPPDLKTEATLSRE